MCNLRILVVRTVLTVYKVIQFFTQIICFYCREHERQSHIGLESSKLDFWLQVNFYRMKKFLEFLSFQIMLNNIPIFTPTQQSFQTPFTCLQYALYWNLWLKPVFCKALLMFYFWSLSCYFALPKTTTCKSVLVECPLR